MSELDDRLRAHYVRARLPADSVQELLALHAMAAEPVVPAGSRWRQRARWACVAGLLGIAVVLYHTGFRSGERLGSHAELGTRTLREVAMNHLARLDPDFRGDSIAALDERMDRLPFSLTVPERVGTATRIDGSRYCSLAGHLAAHLTLRDTDSGRPVSLFITAVAPDVQRLDGLRDDVAGLDIELWQEEGLFYAMATHE